MNTFVVVGFRVDSVNSVFYRKCDSEEKFVKAVLKAAKISDFISIRIVRSK